MTVLVSPTVAADRAATDHDFGGRLVALDRLDVEIVERAEAAAIPWAPPEAAKAAAITERAEPAAIIAERRAPIAAEPAIAPARAEAGGVGARLEVGTAVGHHEIIAAILQGKLGRAEEQVTLDRVARRVAVAREGDQEAILLDLTVAEAGAIEAAADRGMVGGLGRARTEQQRRAGRAGEHQMTTRKQGHDDFSIGGRTPRLLTGHVVIGGGTSDERISSAPAFPLRINKLWDVIASAADGVGSGTDEVQRDPAAVRGAAVLEQIDALPRPQRRPAARHRDR